MTKYETPEYSPDEAPVPAPETNNSEQDERGEQAQDVADEALRHEGQNAGGTESRKAPSPGIDNIGGSETDLVDEMRRMEDTGEIDNSAFAGEPDHDDEPGRYGNGGLEEVSDDDEEIEEMEVTDRP